MLETPVSFAAHGNRLLISQGAVQIYIETDNLPSLIGSAGIAMLDNDREFWVIMNGEEIAIPQKLMGEFIYQATRALRDPGLIH